MSRSPLSRHRAFVAAAAFGLGILAATAAQAFTIDNQSGTNSDGSAKYTDPDSRFSDGGSGNGQKFNFGGATVQFGTRQQGSSDQRYDRERLFSPNGTPYGDR